MPRLCVIQGDGIGREVIPAAVRVLEEVIPGLEIVSAEAGWACFERRGVSVPAGNPFDAIRSCGRSPVWGGFLAFAKGGRLPQRDPHHAPGSLNLYANLRPVRSWPGISPRGGCGPDCGARKHGRPVQRPRAAWNGDEAVAERVITGHASRRIGRCALDLCEQLGRRRLTIVHKANVLPVTDGLFRDSVRAVAGGVYLQRGCGAGGG